MWHKQYRFDPYLDQIQASELKSMMRLWSGRNTMRKDECIATIRRGLSDPERVQTALSGLNDYERAALALVKQMGGALEAEALAVALRAASVALPGKSQPYRDDVSVLVQPLIRRGLLLSRGSSYLGSWGSSRGGIVFSDERLLTHSEPLECVPLPLPAAPSPASSTYRRPPAVILDVVGILQAIDSVGGLRLTKAGTPRTGDVRKLAQAMSWKEQGVELDGLVFPRPALGWIGALQGAGLLSVQGDTLGLSGPIDQFASLSYAEQVDALMHGFILARGWSELLTPSWYGEELRRSSARLALTVALASLPAASESFFAIGDLDQALFERIGEHFSLRFVRHRPYPFNKTAAELRREEDEWRAEVRAEWLKSERRWIEAALSSWLYVLGIVEIGRADGTSTSLRLTELGRAVLHPRPDRQVAEPERPRMAWLVQPNFDVQVFLDQIRPDQLAFLERHAERVQAHQHTAEYRLTRESVYRGLESGTSLGDLLAGLRGGTGMALPQNVEIELRAWAGLREQIRLRRRARLLEYPDVQARQAALANGIAGIPVGDRFVLLDGGTSPVRDIMTRLDYADALPACLAIAEDGTITLKRDTRDLLIRWQLDRWAEPMTDRTWRVTAASTAARIKAGARPTELFKLLKERLTHPLPPLLSVALQAWTGTKHTVALAKVTVLRCREPAVLEAIAQSKTLRPYILGRLAPDLLLVETQQVKALRQKLQWAGIAVEDVLEA